MKILFVAHSAELSGGANRSLLSVMKGLRDTYGIQPSVLVPKAGGEMQEACEQAAIPVYVGKYHTCCTVFTHQWKDVLRFCKLTLAPTLDWLSAWPLSKRLPQDFDLVYTNDRMAFMGGYLARRMGKPHIWHVRSFTREVSTTYPPCHEKLMDRYAQRIVLISQALYQTFLPKISAQKLCVIYNGLELAKYCTKEKEVHQGCRLLLTGRIVQTKGHSVAVKALEILQREEKTRVDLFFAGDVPQYDSGDYKLQLQQQIAAAGLEDRVHFLGEVADITQLRKGMDFELVCSMCEPFGRVTIEAMCAHVPVIGSDSGGTPELIAHQRTGLLYPPGDADRLAQQIMWGIAHPEAVSRMAEEAYLHAQNHFSIGSTVEKIHATILEVAQEG